MWAEKTKFRRWLIVEIFYVESTMLMLFTCFSDLMTSERASELMIIYFQFQALTKIR